MTETTVDNPLDQQKVVRNLFTNALNGNMAKGGDDILQALKLWASNRVADYTGEKAAELGSKFAIQHFNKNEQEAAVIGRRAELIWRLGLPMLTGSLRSFKNVAEDLSQYGTLKDQFSPALDAHHRSNWGYATFFNTDLEVVRNARRHAAHKVNNGLKAELAATVALLPVAVSSYVNKLIDDVHYINQNRESKKAKAPSQNNELDKMRYESAVKVDKKLREWIGKVDPENLESQDMVVREGIDATSQVLTGKGISHFTGSSGPYNLLNDVNSSLSKYTMVGGGLANWLRRAVGVKGENEFNRPSADKMILALQKALIKNPSLTRVTGLIGQSSENIRVEDYVEDIFRQHQKDCGRKEIPPTVRDDLKEACKLIAEAMTDPNRRLHPQALVVLVDGKAGIIKRTKDGAEVTAPEDLSVRLQRMQAQNPGMSLRKRQTPAKYFDDRIFTQEDFVESWKGLTQEEKFVWSTFFPVEIIRSAGEKPEDIARLNSQGNEFWRETVEATLEELQALNSTDMKELGLNSKQVDELRELIKSHIKGNGEEIDKKRHEAMDLTAQIGVAMDRDRPGFLSKILERATEKKDRKQELKQREEEKSFAEQVGGEKPHKIRPHEHEEKGAKIRTLIEGEKGAKVRALHKDDGTKAERA